MSAGSFVLVVLLVSAVPAPVTEAAALAQKATVAIALPAAGETQELTLWDGSRLYGRVVSIEPDRIVFRTVAGVEMTVGRADIAALRVVRGRVVNHEFRLADPNPTRLFFGPTARSLKAGHGYLAVYEVMMPFVQVGLTDRISLGGGTPIGSGDGTSTRPFWISPKAQVFDGARTQVAVGLLHISAGRDDQVGMAYGVTTIGHDDSAVTVGAGYGYEAGGGRAVVVMVSGERRLGRRFKFITENYLWKGPSGILSGGVRFIGDRLSADLGLVVPIAKESVAFPVANFVWSF